MKNTAIFLDEEELNIEIETGETEPVHIPKIASISEIVKFQFCTEIIRFKIRHNLKQKDIAEMVDLDKSEVSKIFSYNLKDFSQERILGFIEILLIYGADINMDKAWEQIKVKSKILESKLPKLSAS